MVWELGALGLASVIGMVVRFGERFLGGVGEIVKIAANILVAVFLVLVAFSPIIPAIGTQLLTGITLVAFLLYVSLGYAAASLIAELIGM